MPKRYNQKRNWKNKPSIISPINEINLNAMDEAIYNVDSDLADLEDNLPERIADKIGEANEIIIDQLTAGANAAANICEGVLDGNNTFIDPNTGKYYVFKVIDGKPELVEVPPNPNPPLSQSFLQRLGDLETGKFNKSDIVQTLELNDPNKVPSSAVTHFLNEKSKVTTYTPTINTVIASLLGYQLFEKIGNLVIVKCWLQIVLPSFSVGAEYHLMTIPHKPKTHLYFRGHSVNGFGGFVDNCGFRIDTNGDVVIILSGVTSFNRGAGIVIDFTFTT